MSDIANGVNLIIAQNELANAKLDKALLILEHLTESLK